MAFAKICDEILDTLDESIDCRKIEKKNVRSKIDEYEHKIAELENSRDAIEIQIAHFRAIIAEDNEALKIVKDDLAKLMVARLAIKKYKAL